MTTFEQQTIEEFRETIKKQKLGPSTEILEKSVFPDSSWKPKVQTPFYVPPGNVPRKIEIERFLTLNF